VLASGSALCPPAGCTGGEGCQRSRGGPSDTWVSRRRRRSRTPTAPRRTSRTTPTGASARGGKPRPSGNPRAAGSNGARQGSASRFSAWIPQPTARAIVARAVVAQLSSALELTAAVRADPAAWLVLAAGRCEAGSDRATGQLWLSLERAARCGLRSPGGMPSRGIRPQWAHH
jgi:hypothetical protein